MSRLDVRHGHLKARMDARARSRNGYTPMGLSSPVFQAHRRARETARIVPFVEPTVMARAA